VTDQLNNI